GGRDRLAEAQRAGVGLLLPGDHAEKGRLAGAVRPDHADDAARREAEREVLEQELVAEALGEAIGLHHHVAEASPGRDVDLRAIELPAAILGEQRLVVLEPRLRLRATRPRVESHPLELALDGPLPGAVLLLLLGEPLLLLLEPRRVVALVRDAAAAVELEDPPGHVVEEV